MITEYKEQLKRHFDFIQRSCEYYDRGKKEEALRIAVSLRVLFHDTTQSKSLLSHIGVKDKVHLLSTFQIEKEELENNQDNKNLFMIQIPLMLEGIEIKSPLDNSGINKKLLVKDWWNEIIMIQINSISRKDIVLSSANQDGGAHVDSNPNKKTKELQEGVGTLTITMNGETKTQKLNNHHFPLLRQLGYEILNSPELFSLL